MISVVDLKRGVTIDLDGQLMSILEWQHIKIGRGGATVRAKMRNLRSGAIFERTFAASEKFPRVEVEERPVQLQYQDGVHYYFRDTA